MVQGTGFDAFRGCSIPDEIIGVFLLFFWMFGPISGTGCKIIFFRCRGDGINDADLKQPESEVAEAHFVWQYFTVINNTEAKKGGSKNAQCMFFLINLSVCAVHQNQLHISWRVLS